MLENIKNMLNNCDGNNSVLPATILYNEGWMIRIILDLFSKYSGNIHQFSFVSGSKWYSEGLLPSIFLPKYQGDDLAESWTHADAIIGNFTIGNYSKSDLKLIENARQFSVIEAKMFSKLSAGTTNARNFDQAARNVACMAETLRRADINSDDFEKLGFFVIAPSSQIEKEETFRTYTDIDNIKQKVSDRVQSYKEREDFEEKIEWFDKWFLKMLDKIVIECLTWEEVIYFILENDKETGEKLSIFYDKCLRYNQ